MHLFFNFVATSGIIPFSIKYRNKYGETDIILLEKVLKEHHENWKIGLIVKDKNLFFICLYFSLNKLILILWEVLLILPLLCLY